MGETIKLNSINFIRLFLFVILWLPFYLFTNVSAQTVQIGTQIWCTKNLDLSKFRNGETIPLAKSYGEWVTAGNEGKPAWCYYSDNNGIIRTEFGKLYNWYAIIDPRGLAPLGYHIPSDNEWKKLMHFLGGNQVAGIQMKSTYDWCNFEGWKSCTICSSWSDEYRGGHVCTNCNDTRTSIGLMAGNGKNTCGFNGLPTGCRDTGGSFRQHCEWVAWWSTTEDQKYRDAAWSASLWNESESLSRMTHLKSFGFYVRCLKDD